MLAILGQHQPDKRPRCALHVDHRSSTSDQFSAPPRGHCQQHPQYTRDTTGESAYASKAGRIGRKREEDVSAQRDVETHCASSHSLRTARSHSRASQIENLRPIIPEVPAFVPESLEDPFNRFGAVGCDADQGKPNPPQTEGSLLTTPADHADFWLDLELPPIISSQTFVPHPSDSWGRVPWQAVQSFR